VRILAGQIHSTRQQVIRIDYEGSQLNDAALRNWLEGQVRSRAADSAAVIISDYNYGVVDGAMADLIRQATNAAKIPVTVDSRFQLSTLNNFTSATPNEDEMQNLLGQEVAGDGFSPAGDKLRKGLGLHALLVTRGGQGMTLFEEGLTPLHIDAVGARDPVDVTGAGDTVIATYTLALACDGSFADASRLANYAGGLVVMKRGTATISQVELEQSVRHYETG
jgi:rfaE bifunctional protein kinase chain/domain